MVLLTLNKLRVALDLDRTVQENTCRYWPYTRGRIYCKPGASSELLWEAKRVWGNDYRRGLTSLPPNVRFQVEYQPWEIEHVRAVG
eukprot:5226852-Pyramimonas_sp.AAC.1